MKLFLKSMWTKYVFLFSIFLKFPFIFIDAEEINANVDEKKNGILVILRTRIIHKLTAFCLQLSFHLTFKFLVLRTNRQFFLFFCYVLNVKQQFKVDAPMQIFPFWSPKILPLNLDVFL